MEVPFVDLKKQNNSLITEIIPLWEEIFCSSEFIGGKHVQAFEREFADACSVKHCILLNSGTDALRFILIALDLSPGDEVITVPNTFIATTEAISQAGGKIVFVDIDPDTYNMDPLKLKSVISKKTKGIIPVHLYGQPANIETIQSIADEYNLWVVEDACQAHLAKYKGQPVGSVGIAGAFSFYPAKNLGACGESGAVTTNNEAIASRIKMLRDHGQNKKYYHEIEGFNGRCDAIQAAALRVKLKHLPKWNEKRRNIAKKYIDHLQEISRISLPIIDKNSLPVFHLFVIQLEKRDRIREDLFKMGISTGLHYPIPLHLQKAYEYLNLKSGSFPFSEAHAKKTLSLPIYPELTDDQVFNVIESLEKVINDQLNG